MAELLDIRNLRIVAPDGAGGEAVIVDDVSFRLERGKVLGLIGESGAGKSTIGLASMAYGRGAVRISGGEILLDGQDLTTLSARSIRQLRGRRVAYVAQSAAAAFNPAHRIGTQVIEAALRHGTMRRDAAMARARALFATLGLPDPDTFGNRFPHQVSGGQLQRAMTAMALCAGPELIVFDEPTTALDVTTQIGVLAAIRRAIRETGTAAIYITHDLAVVAQIADDIMVLRHGRMVETGTARQIVDAPRQDYTRALVSVRHETGVEAEGEGERLLTIDHVTARYGSGGTVLDDVSLSVPRGRTVAVVGESGSGKSTLARVITGLLPPAQGRVQLEGRDLSPALGGRSKADRRRIQLIYQMADTALNPRQTVADIVGRPLTFYEGLRGRARAARVAALLDEIEIPQALAGRYPAELSGGQKQRVAIARALAAQPDLVICDEPTSALDPLVAQGILKLLRRIQRERGTSYLFITHDIATVRAIADAVAVMHRGRIVRSGPRSQALNPPFDDYTARLMNSVPDMRVGWLDEAIAAAGRA
ncbi:ABC transporter ATP-binding protein [Aureimonas frigidaquae]|uniref:ABC transporter ATP-binding protein n=1 Tax=Aureimonas frigidaquae TaxID=424757 RepID=UPI0007817693|nr:ABC transporter ATP-binding protein [Aureimonas frigidaquae]